jgi:hypothetical protein
MTNSILIVDKKGAESICIALQHSGKINITPGRKAAKKNLLTNMDKER